MTVTRPDLLRFAAASGFQPDALEKVLHLLALLGAIRAHPFLGTRVALKGGTALNLFALDVPRLSVDVDLNYIGAADRATTLAERPQFERALRDVCERLHLTVHRVPGDFAGGKWRLSYVASGGGRGTLELDVNFVLRTPLWPPSAVRSHALAGVESVAFPVLDLHELAAGKLAALLARGASRDLFDARALLQRGGLDVAKLRLAFVVYGGANRVEWRTVNAGQVTTTPSAGRSGAATPCRPRAVTLPSQPPRAGSSRPAACGRSTPTGRRTRNALGSTSAPRHLQARASYRPARRQTARVSAAAAVPAAAEPLCASWPAP